MSSPRFLPFVAAALFPLTAACDPSSLQPIETGSSSSTSTTSTTSTSSGAGGNGGNGGGSSTSGTGGDPAQSCAAPCGSGAVCVEGQCHALVELDPSINGANEGVCTIALDALNVYWMTSEVRRVPKAGGASTLLDSGTASPGGLVVDDNYLYWLNFGVQRAEKNAPANPGTSAGSFYVDAGGNPTRLVGDGATLYYLEIGEIYQAATAAPPAPEAPPLAFSQTWSFADTAIAVDAENVYFWTEGASVLSKVGKAGGQMVTIGTRENSTIDASSGIVADSSGVYFSTAPSPGKGGLVVKTGGGAGQGTVLVDGSQGANGVFTVDASFLYFMTPTGVMRMPKTGGAAVMLSPLSPPSPFPTCIAADDAHVYWVDGSKLMAFTK
ncbi:MAG: hypothetical protein ABI193_17415 [Minicystis sp.]